MPSDLRAMLRDQEQALIMGIVNATPDSFSDGGKHNTLEGAAAHALALVDQGADILDIGGESTRPGAETVSLDQERAAVNAGAAMINDVNGLRANGALDAAFAADVPICIMHMQGSPSSMQDQPYYSNVVDEVIAFFKERINCLTALGVNLADIIVDPGIGFGKTLQHNLELLNKVDALQSATECDVLIGVSRKSLVDKLFGRPVDQRLAGSLGLAVQAVLNGAKIVRVHDVQETSDAVRSVEAVRDSSV